MNTALFAPKTYTGDFVTLNWQENGRGWTVTLWQYGVPKRYTAHGTDIIAAVMEIVSAGGTWASAKMQQLFEQDVILAGGM